LRIVFAGTPAVAVPTLRALAASGHEIVAVVTREDAPLGRKRVLTPSPVAAAADDLGIPTIKANRIGDAETDALRELGADLGVVVAYGGILRRPALEAPAHGWINLHFSLLPEWRGAAPVQRAVLAGDERTGVSVFRLEEGLDTGPLHVRREVAIDPDETAGELLERLGVDGAADVVRAVDGIADGTSIPTPQTGEPTHAAKLTGEDGRVDWALDAPLVHARIRGATPEPGAWTTLDDARFKILRAARADASTAASTPALAGLAPGAVTVHAKRVYVGTGGDPLELVEVQPSGKKAMRAIDWARGTGEGTVFA